MQRLALVALGWAFLSSAAASPPAVYISANVRSTSGAGSIADPFDGSSQAKFDAVMTSIPEGARIQLDAGVFTTRGVHLKNQWQLRGRGKDRTTIRLADGVLKQPGTSANVVSNVDFQGFYDRIEISDLTIDCNRDQQPVFTNGEKGDLTALTTAAHQARIRRVRVRGTWSNPGEGFPLSVVSAGSSDGSNRIEIDACENIAPVGSLTAISAFDQSGTGRISGFIRNCLVVDGPESASFGSGGWKNFQVTGNVTRNMGAGIVIDTHDYENVRIEHNRFYDTQRWGILYNGSGKYERIVVRNNYIEMVPSAEWVLVTRDAKVTTTIERNIFIQGSTTRPAFWIGPNTSGTIRNNVVDALVPTELPVSERLSATENRDLLGGSAAFRRTPVRSNR
jgi:hypothetical protein